MTCPATGLPLPWSPDIPSAASATNAMNTIRAPDRRERCFSMSCSIAALDRPANADELGSHKRTGAVYRLVEGVVADRDNLDRFGTAGRAQRDDVADPGLQHRRGHRRTPRDARIARIQFIDADDGDGALVTILVRERDGRSEVHPFVCLARVVDDNSAV